MARPVNRPMRLLACLLVPILLVPGCLSDIGPGDGANPLDEPAAAACTETILVPALRQADATPYQTPPALPELPDPTTLYTRDEWGVPHIESPTLDLAVYALGAAIAEDRLWQMEVYRLASQGELSSVLGHDWLEQDVLVRTQGYTPSERAGLLAQVEPSTLEIVTHMLAGVNRHIATLEASPERLPLEYAALGIEPAPWTLDDWAALLSIFVILGNFEQGGEAAAARAYLELERTLGPDEAWAAFDDLVPAGSNDAPTTVPRDVLSFPAETRPSRAPDVQLDTVRRAAPLLARAATIPSQIPDGAAATLPRLGSNMIVVSGERSASGGALLLGGPQTGHTVPGTFAETVMDVDGWPLDVFVIPGLGPIMGRSGGLAYSITVGYGDHVDLVVVELDASDPNAYVSGNETVPFDSREERFVVAPRDLVADARTDPTSALGRVAADPPEPVTRTVRRTPMGPVVAYDAEMGLAVVARRASYGLEMGNADALFDTIKLGGDERPGAQLAPVIEDVLHERAASSLNLFVAHADGTAQWVHTGRVPARDATFDRRLPTPHDPATEWDELWAPSCLPGVIDPPTGWMANWNNHPAEGWPNTWPSPFLWGSNHRVEVLQDLMSERVGTGEPLGLDDLAVINEAAAMRNAHAQGVLPGTLEVAGDMSDGASAVADVLRTWAENDFPMRDNGDGSIDHPGVVAYEAWRPVLEDMVFADELGDADHSFDWAEPIVGQNNDHHGASTWSESLVQELVRGGARHDWWDDVSTPDRETGPGVVAASLDAAYAQLVEAHGPDPSAWTRPMTTISFSPLGAGSAPDMPLMNRGTINFLVDFAADEMWAVVPPGQSGHVSASALAGAAPNPHMADQVPLYASFTYRDGSGSVRDTPAAAAR